MPTFKSEILSLLNTIKGKGSFVSHHVADFEFPGLEVTGVGELSYPINATQAKVLIENAHTAPYGQGSKTLVDSNVRSCREIDSTNLTFTGKGWDKFLNKVLKKIKPDLGIEDYEISASLYKMLIYEKGDFFLPHKDSEKESGMFGTLTITLPSNHSGGDLLVNFDGKHERIAFTEAAGNFKLPYAAFYADCEHEIKPITSGYRVCLVYNLIQEKAAKGIKLKPHEEHAEKIADLLRQEKYNPEKPFKIILLGHQYTPEGFSKESLKLNDRSKAEALLRGAEKADYYAKMALVTSYQMGLPEMNYYNEDVDENAIMDEVYDDFLSIEHWMNDRVPSLDVEFQEDDLILSFKLDEGEPIVKETQGYMGNYGPELMHWYHYGAVILWPKSNHKDILLRESTKTKLEWLAHYNGKFDTLTRSEILATEAVLLSDLASDNRDQLDYTPIVDWLILKNDENYFDQKGKTMLEQYFVNMDIKQLVLLAESYPGKFVRAINGLITREPSISYFDHYILLLNAMSSSSNSHVSSWISTQIESLPIVLAGFIKNENPDSQVIKKKTWSGILTLEKELPQNPEWVMEMAKLITAYRTRDYINYVLAAEIMTLNQHSPLANTVLKVCSEFLQNRINNKPQPFPNWTRSLPDIHHHLHQNAVLSPFMKSPDENILDFRKNQTERTEMEYVINSLKLDLKMETIRKGSPHTLRLTKTDASYQLKMAIWNEDKVLLEKVNNELAG